MDKVILSVALSLSIGVIVVAGVSVTGKANDATRACQRIESELTSLRAEIQEARETTGDLVDRFRRLESRQQSIASSVRDFGSAVPATAGESDGEPAEASALMSAPNDLKSFVFAAIEEERQIREEERNQEREAQRVRAEERRKEFEEMREGPYDRYNVKVNSLAKVLEMTDEQKQAYFELTKQYNDKFQQVREKAQAEREAQRAEAAAAGTEGQPATADRGRGGRGRGEDFRQMFQQIVEPLQTEYAAATLSILEPFQIDGYNELSDSSKSFMNMGLATAAGEEDNGMFGRMMGTMGGGPQQGGRGGRGGGR